MFMKFFIVFTSVVLASAPLSFSQTKRMNDPTLKDATLQNCIDYAISNQPLMKQSLLNEKITNQMVQGKLADWFPQLNFNFTFQHDFKLPTSIFRGTPVQFGVANTSGADISLTQTLFNRDVLLASSTAYDVSEQARQKTVDNEIYLAVEVSKAFYGVLLAKEQITLVKEDTSRLHQTYEDAFYQYKSGTVDKTDYESAEIALNNAVAQLRSAREQLTTSYAILRDVMGYPSDKELNLAYDSTQMVRDAYIDTTWKLNYQNRIEYKLLQTNVRLQKANLDYYYWSFLPSISIVGDYAWAFQSQSIPALYNANYPSAYAGIQLSIPIFQGGKRFREIDQASLEVQSSEYEIQSLKDSIDVEYTQAIGNYESNLSSLDAAKKNLSLAKDVYKTIELQYRSGVKTYLDVITAETNLRATEVNYYDSLYQLLSSKLDVEQALGTVKY